MGVDTTASDVRTVTITLTNPLGIADAGIVSATVNIKEDRDGDGVYDEIDAFPDDPTETLDTDGDLIGNNTDDDDDGDGLLDIKDVEALLSGDRVRRSSGKRPRLLPRRGRTSLVPK